MDTPERKQHFERSNTVTQDLQGHHLESSSSQSNVQRRIVVYEDQEYSPTAGPKKIPKFLRARSVVRLPIRKPIWDSSLPRKHKPSKSLCLSRFRAVLAQHCAYRYRASRKQAGKTSEDDHLPQLCTHAKQGRRGCDASQREDQDWLATECVRDATVEDDEKHLDERKERFDRARPEADVFWQLMADPLDHFVDVGENDKECDRFDNAGIAENEDLI